MTKVIVWNSYNYEYLGGDFQYEEDYRGDLMGIFQHSEKWQDHIISYPIAVVKKEDGTFVEVPIYLIKEIK